MRYINNISRSRETNFQETDSELIRDQAVPATYYTLYQDLGEEGGAASRASLSAVAISYQSPQSIG